jgi:hypothetical protein
MGVSDMKKSAWIAMVLLMMAGPAFAVKAYIDYDTEFDSTGKDTFAWAPTSETSLANTDPLLHSRIVNGIEYYLTMSGKHEVETDPALYVTYHTNTQEKVNINTSSYGYGYPGSWGGYYGRGYYGGGMGTSSTTVSSYELGTLVVDVWDAETKKLIWRGTANNITITQNPEKMKKKLDKALKKMLDTWEKIKKKEGIN